MKSKWKPVTEPVYVMPDGSWHFAVDHTSWMGDDYQVRRIGFTCSKHDVWFRYECPQCLRKEIDINNQLEVKFIPHAGQTLNVEDQIVKAINGSLWAVRDQKFKFKVR